MAVCYEIYLKGDWEQMIYNHQNDDGFGFYYELLSNVVCAR